MWRHRNVRERNAVRESSEGNYRWQSPSRWCERCHRYRYSFFIFFPPTKFYFRRTDVNFIRNSFRKKIFVLFFQIFIRIFLRTYEYVNARRPIKAWWTIDFHQLLYPRYTISYRACLQFVYFRFEKSQIYCEYINIYSIKKVMNISKLYWYIFYLNKIRNIPKPYRYVIDSKSKNI